MNGQLGNHGAWRAGSVEEMLACGRELGAIIAQGSVVLLRGAMGAGKTTLAKGIVEGFGAGNAGDVTSPTFTIMHEYRVRTGRAARVLHLDLYRLETEAQVRAIGVEEWLDELEDASIEPSILLVEWGERFPSLWPREALEISIESEEEARTIRWRGGT